MQILNVSSALDSLLFLEVLVLDPSLIFLHDTVRCEDTPKGHSFTFMRTTALARSSGVRNHAVVGLSGNRNLPQV